MLFIPPVLDGPFDRRYIITDLPFLGSPENLFGYRSAARFLVNNLRASEGFWEQLIATRDEYDLRYLAIPPKELVVDLLGSNLFQAYALPTDAELEAFSRYSRVDPSSGTRYRLLPRNSHLLSGVQAIRPYSATEYDDLLQRLGLSEQQLSELAENLPPIPFKGNVSPRTRFSRALLDYELVATTDRTSTPLHQDRLDVIDTTYTPKPVTLGPHDSPGYAAPPPTSVPVVDSNPNTAAQSLNECETRLATAKDRLKTHGYQPKYSDEEILAIAQKGELDDRFIVRFNKAEWLTDENRLSKPDADGSTRTWVTTFNQIENADTDPKVIASVLGITYDPSANYSLIIVDTHAPEAAQAVTIVPTYKNLGEMAKSEIKDIDPELVDQVMTEEYSEVYAEVMAVFETRGHKLDNPKHVETFAARTLETPDDIARFETRILIQKEYGASPHYTGNGATKNLLPKDNSCGVMEVLNVDKNPALIGSLIDSKAAARLQCTPI